MFASSQNKATPDGCYGMLYYDDPCSPMSPFSRAIWIDRSICLATEIDRLGWWSLSIKGTGRLVMFVPEYEKIGESRKGLPKNSKRMKNAKRMNWLDNNTESFLVMMYRYLSMRGINQLCQRLHAHSSCIRNVYSSF